MRNRRSFHPPKPEAEPKPAPKSAKPTGDAQRIAALADQVDHLTTVVAQMANAPPQGAEELRRAVEIMAQSVKRPSAISITVTRDAGGKISGMMAKPVDGATSTPPARRN